MSVSKATASVAITCPTPAACALLVVTGTPNNRRVAGSYGRLKCSIAVWLELVDLALGRAGVGGDFDLRLAEFTVDVAAPPLGRRPDVVVDFAQRLRDAVRDFAGDRENVDIDDAGHGLLRFFLGLGGPAAGRGLRRSGRRVLRRAGRSGRPVLRGPTVLRRALRQNCCTVRVFGQWIFMHETVLANEASARPAVLGVPLVGGPPVVLGLGRFDRVEPQRHLEPRGASVPGIWPVERSRIMFQAGPVGAHDGRIDEPEIIGVGVFDDLAEIAEPRPERPGHQRDAADRADMAVQALPGGDQLGLSGLDHLLGRRLGIDQAAGVVDRLRMFVPCGPQAVQTASAPPALTCRCHSPSKTNDDRAARSFM